MKSFTMAQEVREDGTVVWHLDTMTDDDLFVMMGAAGEELEARGWHLPWTPGDSAIIQHIKFSDKNDELSD